MFLILHVFYRPKIFTGLRDQVRTGIEVQLSHLSVMPGQATCANWCQFVERQDSYAQIIVPQQILNLTV